MSKDRVQEAHDHGQRDGAAYADQGMLDKMISTATGAFKAGVIEHLGNTEETEAYQEGFENGESGGE